MNTKINFMAGLPAPSVKGDLGLAVGQTWRTRDGQMVTVIGHSRGYGAQGFTVKREFGHENEYDVRANGTSVYHGTDRHDLIEPLPRVYLSGEIDDAMNAAAIEYRRKGAFVISPAEMDHAPDNRKNLAAILSCDTLVALPGVIQFHLNVAAHLGMTIIHKE